MRYLLAAMAVSAAGLASAGLRLRTGTYVLSDTSCKDAPFAAMMGYDRKELTGPHAAQCRSDVLARNGIRYRLKTVCRADGDGSPANPTVETATARIRSHTSFDYASAGSNKRGLTYRFCPSE